MMEAAHRGDNKMVKFLLQHGAEVNDQALDVRVPVADLSDNDC